MATTSNTPAAAGVRGLARSARAFLTGIALAATAAAVPALLGFGADSNDLLTFALLGVAAAIAHLCVIETGRNHGFPTALVFLVAGALLLPAELVALLALVQHGPELIQRRYPSYIALFNVSNYTLNLLAAHLAARGVAQIVPGGSEVQFALGGIAACAVFVALNHLLLGTMLRLARGHSLRASRLFGPESLSIDLVLAAIGLVLAVFADANPVLVPAALAPIVLVHRLLAFMASLHKAGGPAIALGTQEARA